MQIVIDIPENLYKAVRNGLNAEAAWALRVAIKNGIPLPENHGRLIDADAFIEFLKHKEYGMIDYSDCVIDDITEDAPTIIESKK